MPAESNYTAETTFKKVFLQKKPLRPVRSSYMNHTPGLNVTSNLNKDIEEEIGKSISVPSSNRHKTRQSMPP